MPTASRKVFSFEVQRAKRSDVFLPQVGEFIEQLRQGLSLALAFLCETVELVEGHALAGVEYPLRSRNPVRALAVDQMSHNIERTPGAFTFVGRRPLLRQVTQQCI